MTIQTHASILKRSGDVSTTEYETAVVEFNGAPIGITFVRGLTAPYATALLIEDLIGGTVLANVPWTGGLGCAIVINGVIHVFGSTNWSGTGNSLIHSTLDANFNPSTPVSILTIPGSTILNTDVCFDGTNYCFVVETSVPGVQYPGLSFYKTPDFVSFTKTTGILNAGAYCACPSIDFVNGKYFITALAYANPTYVTVSDQSSDLVTFNSYKGADAFLAPDASTGEGTNASDVSMAEVNGMVYGVYLTGDQATWMHKRTFAYLGTMSQLVSEFFP